MGMGSDQGRAVRWSERWERMVLERGRRRDARITRLARELDDRLRDVGDDAVVEMRRTYAWRAWGVENVSLYLMMRWIVVLIPLALLSIIVSHTTGQDWGYLVLMASYPCLVAYTVVFRCRRARAQTVDTALCRVLSMRAARRGDMEDDQGRGVGRPEGDLT